MLLKDYLDEDKLAEYVHDGLVEVRYHKSLPLRLYVHTRKAVLENFWDEITTKCRGLIVDVSGEVIARPFEKFFNVDTDWRPETLISNLPLTRPTIAEKLDGSLGILYTWGGKSYIATKGSFFSEQAIWASEWYDSHIGSNDEDFHGERKWPSNCTPIFEIIAESVQHHVVHYGGREELVLIAIINNDTGEEMPQTLLRAWAARNGLRYAESYDEKSLGDVLNEDRKNAEGYVVSWPRAGQPPLKIKVKHPSFLDLQKIVHAATPKAILEALVSKNVNILNTWIGQTNDQLGQWVQGWVVKFNGKYANILLKCKLVTNAGINKCKDRKEFAEFIKTEGAKFDNVYPSVCFAMLDDKDHTRIIWKFVEKFFDAELSKSFAVVEEQ